MSGMPLAGHLPPLIWQVLDRHEETLRSVCRELGIGASRAKAVIGDDPARTRTAFSHIAANVAARREFQTSFALLNQERTRALSVAHTALARLIYSRVVTQIISLNWDTLLEAAFENRYGIQINAQGVKLWKPHGDCAMPGADWVLPHEPGDIPNDLVAGMNAFAKERPRSLVIVGYSERDEVVVQRLISPLAARWRVFRISPNASGEGAIPMPASDALRALAESLCPEPELPGWSVVTFANQRGIEAAVAGERLGPQDVDCCPRLHDPISRGIPTRQQWPDHRAECRAERFQSSPKRAGVRPLRRDRPARMGAPQPCRPIADGHAGNGEASKRKGRRIRGRTAVRIVEPRRKGA
jgi:hypothetical protein